MISEHLESSILAILLSTLSKNPSGLLHHASEDRRPVIEFNGKKSLAAIAAGRQMGALLSDYMQPSDHLVGIGSVTT